MSSDATPDRVFRYDINGLRAISIAAVMAFHLTGGLAPGGFVGVDVFFVISGYLMTGLIYQRLEGGRFRLIDFYAARFRRIAPALVALCIAIWLYGALCMDPWRFEGVAKNLTWAPLFLSNIAFSTGGGYFALDESNDWLLHTWSLSLEWQFYLLYPLVLMALFAWPAARRHVTAVLAVVAGLSLALAIAASGAYASWAFYLLPARAWELLAGGLCLLIAPRLKFGPQFRAALHVGGLVAIGLGIWLARPGVGWPSALTLFPVGGAAAVILSDLKRTYWAENRLVNGLGLASYSIYLWHWPVVVWLRDNGVALTPLIALAAVAAMIGLGALSYQLVERRLTAWLFRPLPRWRLMGGLLAASVALAVAAWIGHGLEAVRTLGAPREVRAALADDRVAEKDWAFPKVCGRLSKVGTGTLCQLGDPAARQVLVLGDSRADQMAPRYAHAFSNGGGLTFLVSEGCVPIPGVTLFGRGRTCGAAWDNAYRWAETAGFKRIVIVGAWPLYFQPAPGRPLGITCLEQGGGCEGGVQFASPTDLARAEFARLAEAVKRLQQRGAEVVLMGSTPLAGDGAPRELYHRTFWTHALAPPPASRSAVEAEASLALDRLRWTSRETGASFVNPLDYLCDASSCPSVVGGRTLFKDFGHWRASMVTGQRFAYLDAWLEAAPPASPGGTPNRSP